ncbi:MAG TPA: hypothetical protein VFS09_01320 [Candidatus Eisenbacteria bacterium]|nr:hypothetical protein [Candidatus Eisenbacteria bacterium]
MKLYRVLGLVLIVAGVFVLWKRPTYATRQDVVRIGDFKASVDERQAVPAWLGVGGVAAGAILLLVGDRRRDG